MIHEHGVVGGNEQVAARNAVSQCSGLNAHRVNQEWVRMAGAVDLACADPDDGPNCPGSGHDAVTRRQRLNRLGTIWCGYRSAPGITSHIEAGSAQLKHAALETRPAEAGDPVQVSLLIGDQRTGRALQLHAVGVVCFVRQAHNQPVIRGNRRDFQRIGQ